MTPYEVIIIGTGPAGLAAGIQARHMGLKVLLVEKYRPGGRLLSARRVENFPLVGGIGKATGRTIANALIRQTLRKGLKILKGDCTRIDSHQEIFNLTVDRETLKARAVIIATGVEPKAIKQPGWEAALESPRLHYDWRALPMQLAGKRVFVLGGGEVAFDQACSLAERKAQVTVFIRGHHPKAFPKLVKEAKGLGVRALTKARIKGCASFPHGLLVSLLTGKSEEERVFDYGLIAIGASPKRPSLSEETKRRAGQGLYFAGDVSNRRYRQAAIAFGDGVKKAMMAYDYLRSQRVRAEI
jgi:thioredoxin reductase (NADPH)